ncbi:hypothetical protein C8J57DRAFT_1730886 [Mycena rebaudengoi]|nr:hypothetical protein C8J57DRAFT_1730886 [Mycena rebaudengoi]
MHRSHRGSGFREDLRTEGATLALDDDSVERPLNSATSLIQMSPSSPKRSVLTSSASLRLFSLILHLTLVVLHLILIVIWAKEPENHLVFSLDHQKTVSLLITAITTTFGTLYSAILVFVTQKLSIQRDLQMDQTVTATHDSAAAWAGVGSAFNHVWRQRTVPASLIGVLSALGYLGNILLLHITTPSLFSLETFTSSRLVNVGTQGLPAFNTSSKGGLTDPRVVADGSLYLLPSVLATNGTTVGLSGGTLYDVLEDNPGSGNATVDATGFNITCGYPTGVDIQVLPTEELWNMTIDGGVYTLSSTQSGIIATSHPELISTSDGIISASAIVLYSTIPIVDSENNQAPWVTLSTPMQSSVSSVQLLRCSQSLTAQTAVVDSQSHKILSAEPSIVKTASVWAPYSGPSYLDMQRLNPTADGGFLAKWADWYNLIPASQFPLDASFHKYASVADLSLIQKLNLRPVDYTGTPGTVNLHDLENSISILTAAMFWSLGHIYPTHGFIRSASTSAAFNATDFIVIDELPHSTFLLQGNASVSEVLIQGRLNLSIIAVSAGLAASIALSLLSLRFSIVSKSEKHSNEDISIDGTGLLHAIWLYRNHPELSALMEHVEHPTDDNLRAAGMVRTRLLAGSVHKRERSGSF